MIYELRLPVPPLSEGASWTGYTLLNWVVNSADDEMKRALTAVRLNIGGDKFRELFESKAAELNRRLGSRILDARGLPADPQAPVLEVN